MTAEEYWNSEGIRFLNEDGTLPTVEERVKEGYCVGWDNGWNVAWDTRDEQDKHRCNPEAGFLRQEINILEAKIIRLRSMIERSMGPCSWKEYDEQFPERLSNNDREENS